MAFNLEIRVRGREVGREIGWLKWRNLRVEHSIKAYYSPILYLAPTPNYLF
jgi:hypothetical protein